MVMLYEYVCHACSHSWDVYKPAAEFDSPEACVVCGTPGTRQITGGSGFMGAKVEYAEYNPGLGCVTKSAEHRRQIAKARGLEEIGNESPDRVQSELNRDKEKARQRSWDEV